MLLLLPLSIVSKERGMQPFQVTIFIIGTIVIVFGAYYVTYYIGLKASGQRKGRVRNRNINLLDRFSISKDKSFCVVEIAGKVYVIGVTNQSMTLLDTFDAAEYAGNTAVSREAASWPAAPGDNPGGGFISRFLFYMSANFAKMRGKGGGVGGSGGAGGSGGSGGSGGAAGGSGGGANGRGSFADSMRSARANQDTGRTDGDDAEQDTGRTTGGKANQDTGRTAGDDAEQQNDPEDRK